MQERSNLPSLSPSDRQENEVLCIICLVTEKIYIEIKDNQGTPGYYL